MESRQFQIFMKGEHPSQLTGMSRGKANPNRERDISGSSSQRMVGDTLGARHVRLAHRRFAELQYQVRRTPRLANGATNIDQENIMKSLVIVIKSYYIREYVSHRTRIMYPSLAYVRCISGVSLMAFS